MRSHTQRSDETAPPTVSWMLNALSNFVILNTSRIGPLMQASARRPFFSPTFVFNVMSMPKAEDESALTLSKFNTILGRPFRSITWSSSSPICLILDSSRMLLSTNSTLVTPSNSKTCSKDVSAICCDACMLTKEGIARIRV